jgi:acyl-CoA dehydrogenase
MTTEQSHENELLLKTVQSFLEAEIYPHEEEVDRTGEVPIELGRQIEQRSKEVGLFASNLPEAVGGGGLDYKAMSLVEREYGKTTHALHSWIARPTEILLACKDDQIIRYLDPCVIGEKRELFALTEPEAGSDVMGMKTNAKKDGDDWILNGSKHFISGPVIPDFAIVFAATGVDETPRGPRKRVTAFLVDVGLPGFECKEGHKCVSYRGYKTFSSALTMCALDQIRFWAKKGAVLSFRANGLGWAAFGSAHRVVARLSA